MADGKWIEDVRPDMSLCEAARRVLRVRLEVVHDALPLAIAESDRDPEHVHRLRVATRRADAALRIFRSTLPDKVFKAARRRLKRVRHAAGVVRDWDVFLLDLLERRARGPAREQSGLDFLAGFALGLRNGAHPELATAAGRKDPDFAKCPREVVAAVATDANGATLGQLARPLLSSLLHELEEAVQGDLTDYSRLHRVRIAGKRLRYALELFPACFPQEYRDSIYPRVEEMQDILGQANDSHVASTKLEALREQMAITAPLEWGRVRAGLEGVLRSHKSRLPQARRRFLTWWKRWTKDGRSNLRRMLRVEAASG